MGGEISASEPTAAEIQAILENERVAEFHESFRRYTLSLCVPIYLFYWILDIAYAPQLMWEFFFLRLTIIPINVFYWNYGRRQKSPDAVQFHGLIYTLALAGIVTIIIYLTGQPHSPYYAGLNVIMVAMATFFPWSPRFYLPLVSCVFGPYFCILALSYNHQGSFVPVLLNTFFVLSIAIVVLVFRWFNERLRISEIKTRLQLRHELSNRESIIKEKTAVAVQKEAEGVRKDAMVRTAQMLAHDIRKPYAMLQAAFAQQNDSMLGDIRTAFQHTQHMIDELLALGSQQAELPKAWLSWNQLLSDVAKLIPEELRQKASLINFENCDDLLLYGSNKLLLRTLSNLVHNGLEAMQSPGVLRLRAQYSAAEHAALISVHNDNSFIDLKLGNKIFDPFYTLGKADGTGLGLAIVKKAVEEHESSIAYRSNPKDGTTFYFKLKARLSAEVISKSQPFRVAVVDDDQIFLDMWTSRINDRELSTYSTPELLLSDLRSQHFDLIIIDFYFGYGDLNGEQLAQQIRVLKPKQKMFLSTNSLFPHNENKYFDAVIPKEPLSLAELKALLNKPTAGGVD